MPTIALIGGDGAGKTTIAHAVIDSSNWPMKYLYMGLSTRSSNYALPTSRLVLFLKKRRYNKAAQKSASPLPGEIPANQLEYGKENHSWIWNTARFLNRLAEAYYRQLISINYQMRGYLVIYDRHFFFDSAPVEINSYGRNAPLLDRVYFWLISHLYPRPTLTIFLDATPKLLYQRKGEATTEYLAQQRMVFLEQGKKVPNFILVDASQPLEKVLSQVQQHIQDFYTQRYPQQSGIPQR